MTLLLILTLAALCLAWYNGANDNFIGVATLYGSRTCTYHTALIWATLSTAVGALVSIHFAQLLVQRFNGAGFLTQTTVGLDFLVAVAIAAACTKWLATRLGMPASTTHALIGGMLGAGLVASGASIQWGQVMAVFLLPLLLSVALATALTLPLYLLLHRLRRYWGVTRETCLCAGLPAPGPMAAMAGGQAMMPVSREQAMTLTLADQAFCVQRYAGVLVGCKAQTVVDSLHYFSAAVLCFARAVSDTPKIAALLLAGWAMGGQIHGTFGLLLVAGAMLAGGWLHARRVALTMSQRISDLNPGQGLTANLVTAGLVLGASRMGLPVSTTQVACGSIFAIGLANGTRRWHTLASIGATWLLTLPLAMALGAVVMLIGSLWL